MACHVQHLLSDSHAVSSPQLYETEHVPALSTPSDVCEVHMYVQIGVPPKQDDSKVSKT
jgi:hypothetical protein